MTKQSKKDETSFKKSIIRLTAVFFSIILINYIASSLFFRLDLTAEKRYTLNETSKELLENMKNAVFIQVYLDGEDLPIGFNRLQKSIKETLDEFKIYADNNIEYSFIDPSASNDKKIRLETHKRIYSRGLRPIELKHKDKSGKVSQKVIFPGAMLIYKGREIAVNLLKNNRGISADVNLNNSIQSLEYELTNAIRKIAEDTVRHIAFIEGHGELHEYTTRDMEKALAEYYQIDRGRINPNDPKCLDMFAAIVIAKPTRKFSEKEKYVIDQYLMKGGKILWLVEGAVVEMDSLYKASHSSIVMANDLNLSDQFFKYGIRINPDLVKDLRCTPIGLTASAKNAKARIKLFPWNYFPMLVSRNNHHINKYLNLIKSEFASSIDTVKGGGNLKKTILLKTSQFSKKQVVPFRISLDEVNSSKNEKSFNKPPQAVAVLVEGTFESVFKNRVNPLKDSRNFKTESKPTRQVFISDGDIIRNEVSPKGEVYPLGFDKHSQKTFGGNKEFILNAVNYLCDDEGVMRLRSRELKMRVLDKKEVMTNRSFWQIINVVLPIIFIIIFGLIVTFMRKRKYSK